MINQLITVNARKFDFSIHKSWKAKLIDVSGPLLTLAGEFGSDVTHPHLGTVQKGTVSYEFFWLDQWYSVFRFHEPDGEFRNFYCNINQPPVLSDEGVLDFVDLDIDLLVRKDLSYEVLDREEFSANAAAYGYPEQTVLRAKDALTEVAGLIERHEFPFDSVSAVPARSARKTG